MNEMPTLTNTSYAAAVSNTLFTPAVDSDASDQRIRTFLALNHPELLPQRTEESAMGNRRLVRVLMIDPDEDVPVEQALLYDSKEIFTDKTDQELFFDMPVTQILTEHNAKRTKIIDRSVKDRTEYLEAARIRDLKMVVVDLVKF